MATEHPDYRHNTDKEIEFLRGIPNGRWKSNRKPAQIRRALTSYIRTAGIRVWCSSVDVDAVTAYATSLLAEFEGAQAT